MEDAPNPMGHLISVSGQTNFDHFLLFSILFVLLRDKVSETLEKQLSRQLRRNVPLFSTEPINADPKNVLS